MTDHHPAWERPGCRLLPPVRCTLSPPATGYRANGPPPPGAPDSRVRASPRSERSPAPPRAVPPTAVGASRGGPAGRSSAGARPRPDGPGRQCPPGRGRVARVRCVPSRRPHGGPSPPGRAGRHSAAPGAPAGGRQSSVPADRYLRITRRVLARAGMGLVSGDSPAPERSRRLRSGAPRHRPALPGPAGPARRRAGQRDPARRCGGLRGRGAGGGPALRRRGVASRPVRRRQRGHGRGSGGPPHRPAVGRRDAARAALRRQRPSHPGPRRPGPDRPAGLRQRRPARAGDRLHGPRQHLRLGR